MTEDSDYILTEIWRAKPSWMSLSVAAGFLKYFDQVNFSGSMISPNQLNADMIQLQ